MDIPQLIEQLQSDIHTVQSANSILRNAGNKAESLLHAISTSTANIKFVVSDLVDAGAGAVEPLLQALSTSEGTFRTKIVMILGKIGDARAIEPLIDLLNRSDGKVGNTIRVALWRLGAVDTVLEVPHAEAPHDARAIASLLQIECARMMQPVTNVYTVENRVCTMLGAGNLSSVPALIQKLLQLPAHAWIWPNWGTYTEFLKAHRDLALPRLFELVLSDRPDDVTHAASILCHIREPQSREPLLTAFRKATDREMRYRIAETLASIRQQELPADVSECLLDVVRHGDEANRFFVLNLIVERGHAQALPTDIIQSAIETARKSGSSDRCDAIRLLGAIGGTEAIDTLIEIVKQRNGNWSSLAARMLGRLGDRRAITPLIAEVGYGRIDGLAPALARLRPPEAFDVLAAELHRVINNDGSTFDIIEIVNALRKLGDRRAVESLMQALEFVACDLGQTVTYSVLDAVEAITKALARFGDLRAAKPIVRAIKARREYYTLTMLKALSHFADPAAIEVLLTALAVDDPEWRLVALQGFAKVADARALEPLLRVFAGDDEDLAALAGKGLAHIGAEAAAMVIFYTRSEQPWRRRYAAWILGQAGDERAIEPMLALLRDEDESVRAKAAHALQRFSAERMLEPLLQALADPSPLVRAPAAVAFGNLPAARGEVARFTPLLHDTSWTVRRAAAYALQKLEGISE